MSAKILYVTQGNKPAATCQHTAGQWDCVTCDEMEFHNNFQAHAHHDEYPKHKILWYCFECNNLQDAATGAFIPQASA